MERGNEAYSDLLRYLATIKSELQASKQSETILKQENQFLVEVNEQNKTKISELRDRLEETKASLQGQIRMALMREKELGNLEIRWQARMDEERKELEKESTYISEQSVTHEKIKAQIVDEIRREYAIEVSVNTQYARMGNNISKAKILPC